MRNDLKVGDIVTVAQKAWCRYITNPKHDKHLCQGDRYRLFKILAMNAAIPVEPPGQACANTLLMAVDNMELIAVNDCNITIMQQSIEIKFTVNGMDVTDSLSEQSKKAIFEASL